MPSGIQTNRTAVSLPTELSQEIMQKAKGSSTIMRLAQKEELPGRGLSIPTITGDPEAEWVTETDAKPVKKPGIGMKNMTGYVVSVILPFSNQFRRDMRVLYDNIVERLPGALALKVDKTVIGAVAAPGENFQTLSTATTQSLIATADPAHSTYDGLVDADADISAAGYLLNGFALSPAARSILLGAVDKNERPLFVNSPAEGAIPQILGVPTYYGRGVYKAGTAAAGSTAGAPAIIGIAGDWTQAKYGLVNDVQISISDQATLTYTDELDQTVTINLWQRNMFAVRAEMEIGFVANVAAFNLLTGETPNA